MKFAVLGRTQWLYESIKACIARGHEVALIGTCPEVPEYKLTENDFLKLAGELNCPSFSDHAINNPKYIQMVKESKAEVAISVNWLTRIGSAMLNAFKHGIINAHAGDLPRFRGNACPNWAILTGENKVVITLHKMTEELDAGPILLQRDYELRNETYIKEIYEFMDDNIPIMFAQVLDSLEMGRITPKIQSMLSKDSLRCFPRLHIDSEIDWNKSAINLARLVRASGEPFAGAYTFKGDERIVVWKAHAEQLAYPYLGIAGQVVDIRSHNGEVAVLTGDGILLLEEIETLSSGRKLAFDIIKSTRIRLGLNFTENIINLSERVNKLESLIKELIAKQ